MNPYLLLVIVVGWGASVGGAFFYGIDTGVDRKTAEDSRVGAAILEVREQAQQGAAEAIAKLKPVYTTIHQETEREIQTNTVYRDCRVPADGVRLANEALTGQRAAVPASGGKLPKADANDAGR